MKSYYSTKMAERRIRAVKVSETVKILTSEAVTKSDLQSWQKYCSFFTYSSKATLLMFSSCESCQEMRRRNGFRCGG